MRAGFMLPIVLLTLMACNTGAYFDVPRFDSDTRGYKRIKHRSQGKRRIRAR